MTEEEMLGIAEEQTEAAPETESTETSEAQKAEGEISGEEMMEICVRYEKARTPWAEDAEARQIAVANASGEDAEEYLKEVLAWHEAGEPEIAEEGEEPETAAEGAEEAPAPKSEAQMLGIED